MAQKPKDEKRTNTFEDQKNCTIEYYFTDQELKEKSRELADACHEKDQLETSKKEVMSEFKHKLDGVLNKMSLLSDHVSNGYHRTTVKCRVVYYPDKCQKEVYYEGKLYQTDKMTDLDYQTKLEIREHE